MESVLRFSHIIIIVETCRIFASSKKKSFILYHFSERRKYINLGSRERSVKVRAIGRVDGGICGTRDLPCTSTQRPGHILPPKPRQSTLPSHRFWPRFQILCLLNLNFSQQINITYYLDAYFFSQNVALFNSNLWRPKHYS